MARRVSLRESLEAVARRAIAAVGGGRLVADALAARTPGPRRVWAVGKAAPAMAAAAAQALGDDLDGGLIVTKDPGAPLARLPSLSAAHPVPDERSVAAAHALLAEAHALAPSARALLLLSGGTSSLLSAPLPGGTLASLQATTRALLAGGASIQELNVVRRHLGLILGGRLARATRGALDVLALSDVVGDDPAAIGSGPASPDPSTLDDARRIAHRYGVDPSPLTDETPKPGDPCFARVRYQILATPLSLRTAAVAEARAEGLRPVEQLAFVEGDLERFADELVARAPSLSPGEVLVAVGEPTVRVSATGGRGGRAQHLALTMARAIAGSDLAFVACGSDGSDGPTPAAGAAVDGDTWRDPPAHTRALAAFDAHSELSRLGATLATGPTGTNLTDLFLLARRA